MKVKVGGGAFGDGRGGGDADGGVGGDALGGEGLALAVGDFGDLQAVVEAEDEDGEVVEGREADGDGGGEAVGGGVDFGVDDVVGDVDLRAQRDGGVRGDGSEGRKERESEDGETLEHAEESLGRVSSLTSIVDADCRGSGVTGEGSRAEGQGVGRRDWSWWGVGEAQVEDGVG